MDPDQDPPRRVPAPRDGGRDTGCDAGGEAWYPVVPAPRCAPVLERLPDGVATLTERPAPSTDLVLAPRPSAALAARDAGAPRLLPSWARVVARAVHVAVDGLRSLLGTLLVPAPAAR